MAKNETLDLNSFVTDDQKAELIVLISQAIQTLRDDLYDSLQEIPPGEIEKSSSQAKLFENTRLHDTRNETTESFDKWAVSILKTLGLILDDKSESDLKDNVDSRGVVKSLLLLLLSLETYDSRTRGILKIISLRYGITRFVVLENEVAEALIEATLLTSDGSSQKRAQESSRLSRGVKIGLASLAGGVIAGVTGGLAAPLVAAGIGAVFGGIGLGSSMVAGLLGTMAASSTLVGGLFGGYGAKMMGGNIARYTAEIDDFQFESLQVNSRLHVTIGITGWLTDEEEVVRPWRIFSDEGDQYALRWEVDALVELGNAFAGLAIYTAITYAKAEILRRTVLASLMTAFWPIALLKVANILDNPWRIAFIRANKAGRVLADVIINKSQGNRPVTLVGFSLGARVIYSCLLSLAERNAYGLVENAYLLGTPCPCRPFEWQMMRSVVSGRLVNVFSTNDFLLGFLYRTANIQLGVAGLQAIPMDKGVENIDVSDLLEGHFKYRWLVGRILKERVQVDDILDESVYKQEDEGEMYELSEEMSMME